MSMTIVYVEVGSRSRQSRLRKLLPSFTELRRAYIEVALACVLYLGFACYLTWPLITNLSHSIYGAPGDPYGTMAFFGNLVAHHQNPFLPGTVTQFAAPEGLQIPWTRDIASAPGTLSLYLLTTGFGEVAAYGLYTLAGYTLTGVATFLLARRLTKNTWVSLIAGWAYAFYPFAAINGQSHLDFTQGWVLTLALWRMVELMWSPTLRNGLFAGLAVALGMWWSPYFILFVGVVYVAMTAATVLLKWRKGNLRSTLRPLIVPGAIVLVFFAFLGALSTLKVAQEIGVRSHSVSELDAYAARPLEYLLPDVQSPLFGSSTRGYLKTLPFHGSGPETTLYVGVTLILLGLLAFAYLLRRRLSLRSGSAVLALWFIAFAAILTSFPPEAHILGSSVPLPSHFISQLTTTWRVYSRFVMVVMLAFTLLAAMGLDALTRGRESWTKITILSLASLVIPLDLWAPQHGHVTRISAPNIYRVLARQPPGLVAEYPLAPADTNLNADIFYQRVYHKPILGGYQEGSVQEGRAYSLTLLSMPWSASRLATLGVRYVLLDASPSTWGWQASGKPGIGFRLIASEPFASLYLVAARPRNPALATTSEGFLRAGFTASGPVTWLEQTSGKIDLIGLCTSCEGTLSMTLESIAQPRTVTILDSPGHVLEQLVLSKSTPVRIPLRFSRHTSLTLKATPGPQPYNEEEGSPSVSVRVSNLEFIAPLQVVGSPTGGAGAGGTASQGSDEVGEER
jgi:hypothetical protein